MDAAQKFFNKIAFFLSIAFLIVAPAKAQTLQVSTNTVSLPPTPVTISVTSSGADFNFTVSNPSVPWFTVTPGSSSGAIATPRTLTIQLTGSPIAAASGTFTLAHVGASSDTQTITVNYVPGGVTSTISATPTELNPSVAFGGSLQSAPITLSTLSATPVGFSVSVAADAGVPIFITQALVSPAIQQVSATSSATITVTSDTNVAGIANNSTYVNTITITPLGGGGNTLITVRLTVGSGGGGILSNLTLTQSSLTFNAAVSGAQQTANITASAANGGSASFYISSVQPSSSWLSASVSSSTLPAIITVTASPIGLSATTYNGLVNVTFTGSINGTQSIPVVLVVGTGGSTGNGDIGPTTLNFAYQVNSNQLVPQQVVTVSGTGAIGVAVKTSGDLNWLSASGTGTAPGSVVVYVVPSNLGIGDYTGLITITTTSATNYVSVNLKVTNGVVLYANPPTINVGSQPVTTSVSLTTSDLSSQSFTATSPVSWVTVRSASGSTPASFTVSVNPAGLSNGVNTANITINSVDVANSPVTVPVVALVTGSTGGGGAITPTPTSLAFTYDLGGNSPTSKTLALASASGSTGVTATVVASTSSGGNWLSAGVANGTTITTPVNLTVSANVSGLGAGNYQGKITITPVGGAALDVPVTLAITAPSITASTANGTSLSWSYKVGEGTPVSQPITVSGSGTFSVTTQITGSWLTVSPTSGTAPTTLSATVNPADLGAGTYTGSIVVQGTGGTTGSTTISVSVSVTAPLPTIDRVTNAASYISGTIAPGEIISIFGKAIGPETAALLTLDQNGRVSTSLGGVQVSINGFLAPLTLASAFQINAVVPYEVKGQLYAVVVVRYANQTSNGITVPVAATAPGIFTANASGTGPAAVVYPNPTLASATRGDVIVLYATGEGETNPFGITGRVTPGTQPFTVPLLTPVVLIDGQPAQVLFYGEAPTYTSGLLQLNVRIPDNARSGNLPVLIRIGIVDSQPNVTIAVR